MNLTPLYGVVVSVQRSQGPGEPDTSIVDVDPRGYPVREISYTIAYHQQGNPGTLHTLAGVRPNHHRWRVVIPALPGHVVTGVCITDNTGSVCQFSVIELPGRITCGDLNG